MKKVIVYIALIMQGFISQSQNKSKPNVVFILIDDFGWMDVGYNGSSFYETPEINKLSKEWMRFDNCYTPSPMCSPTRTSILTGKNPARHGITQWLPGLKIPFTKKGEKATVFCPKPLVQGIEEKDVTIGEAFQEAGYETSFMGKWHMGSFKITGGPLNHGYDSQKAVIESNVCRMFYPFWDHPEYFPNAKEGDNYTDLLTDEAIDFVSKKREKPFYLHLAHFAMHAPIETTLELRTKFEKKANRIPENGPFWKDYNYAHKKIKARQDDAEYAGELFTLDKNIGKLVKALKDKGLYDNTIIVFTGDNGGRSCFMHGHPTSNEPLKGGKTFVFEGGVRTPLLIHWPGHSLPGKQTNVPVTSMDFYPTLLEMAGLSLKPEQHIDGKSFVPLFAGEKFEHKALYWHFPHYQGEGSYPSSAIRVGNYKMIYHYHHDKKQLFDVVNDPYEKKDLASEKVRLTNSLHKKLKKYLKESGAVIPQPIVK
ncbi:arylsulfatase A-like enzyme [Wenyingzhuangia heitensis]|uniref:Arylsulfatase A-like enzyme n=1 Tax=Wenyingzhuangia heitensis TaxID=1487859 RepID=A0ABX0UE87_9FLAO|nr:sulfatase [Wenyingzhuangia heitensis]NIJ45831.1 arylsulfatase A-like enzyme [Wenyingzhuangia heitensis]